MSQFDDDVASARQWILAIGWELSSAAMKHNEVVDAMLSKCILMAECAKLPGDAPLRIRCTPHVFSLKA